MKRLLYLSIFSALAILQSCEQVVDGDLEHVEKLVIYAIIENGGPIEGIQITKTLPPLGSYQPEDAIVSDAKGTVTINGGVPYVLSVRGFGGDYLIPNSPIVQAGDSLYLEVTWKGNVVTASTVIPEEPEIDYLSGYIREIEDNWGYTYRSISLYAHLGNLNPDNYYIGNIYSNQSVYDNNIRLTGRGESLTEKVSLINADNYYSAEFESIDSIQEVNSLFSIIAYPEEFGAYWNTRYDAQNGGGGFLFDEGRNPIWNVKGGIGIFFGQSRLNFRSSNYTIVTDEP